MAMSRLQEIKKAIRPETRLVVMTHGSNVLGSLQNIRPVAEYCAANDIFLIVDGAQTAGQIPDQPVRNPWQVRLSLPGTRHSSGSPVSGGSTSMTPERSAPVRQGGTGTDSRTLSHPQDMPQKFEAGTPNYPGHCLAPRRYPVYRTPGTGRNHQQMQGPYLALHQGTHERPGYHPLHPVPDLPVVSFNIRDLDNDEAGYILAKAYNIVTRTGLHCAPLVHDRIDGGKGCVRVSFSHLTTPEECRSAADAVREVAESADR